jgi:hypothetical protein
MLDTRAGSVFIAAATTRLSVMPHRAMLNLAFEISKAISGGYWPDDAPREVQLKAYQGARRTGGSVYCRCRMVAIASTGAIRYKIVNSSHYPHIDVFSTTFT